MFCTSCISAFIATGLFLPFAFTWSKLSLLYWSWGEGDLFPLQKTVYRKRSKWQDGSSSEWFVSLEGFFNFLASPWGPVAGPVSQWPIVPLQQGCDLLLKVSLFLHILNQFFSGVTEWSEGRRLPTKGWGSSSDLCSWAVGASPSGFACKPGGFVQFVTCQCPLLLFLCLLNVFE